VLCPPLLVELDADDQPDGPEQEDRFFAVPEEQVDRARSKEQQNHRLAQHFDYRVQESVSLALWQLIRSVLPQATVRLGLR
jgi:hypothetical protein